MPSAEPQVIEAFNMPVRSVKPEDEGFRQFPIVDPTYVDLPGCVEVEEVRLDGITIPPFEDHMVPTDTTHKNFKELRLPNYKLTSGARGVPTLLRGNNSNDGRWQVGRLLHVKGTWEDAPATGKKAKGE